MLSAWTIVRSKKFKKVNKKDQLLLLVIHFTRNALDKKFAYKKRKLYSPAILKWDESDQIIEINEITFHSIMKHIDFIKNMVKMTEIILKFLHTFFSMD